MKFHIITVLVLANILFLGVKCQDEAMAEDRSSANGDARLLQLDNFAGKITDGLAKARVMAGNAARLFEAVRENIES